MSNVKKVLTLVACGCICLMVATSVSADYEGIKTVNKDSEAIDLLCNQAQDPQGHIPFPLTICNVYANFSDPVDRLLSVGNGDMQVFNGVTPDVFFQHTFNPVVIAPTCFFIEFVAPSLICDTFITIGYKCGPAPDGTDKTAPDGDFDAGEFANNGHVVGGWFNGEPINGQGDAGTWPDLQVLFFQSSVAQGHSMSGDMDIFWKSAAGEVIQEADVPIECAAKCTEGDPCNDFDPCTNPCPPGEENCDVCTDGVCTGVPLDCSGLDDDCNEGVCVDGVCESNPINEGGICDDGNDCTVGDQCVNGDCVGAGCMADADCNDGNDCTTDTCDPASGCCTNTPDCTSDADCDDGNDCTDDSCQGDCCVNTPNNDNCDDGNDCTDDICGAAGCEFPPNNAGCDDGLLCTINDGCANGECAGEPVQCPPGADCVEEDADGDDVGDCVFCDTDAECDDDLACNGLETCDPGSGCQDGEPIDCSGAGDQCNVGVCVEPGECVQEPANEGDTCDDDDNCTLGEVCTGGDCVGEPVDCGDDLVCDPSNGECVEVSDFLDIIPGKCPNLLRRNGLGFVKISLLGTDDLDANDVDISSLLLRNVSGDCDGAVAPRMTPRPHVRDRASPFLGELCDCHSRRKDGVDDLDMKFKLAEIVNVLCLAGLPAGTEVRLELTGQTDEGQPIRAADCVILGRDLGPNP